LYISNNKNFNIKKNWKRSHGNHSSNKFSNLDQINVENVKNLEVSWIYEFDKNGDIPGNAIYFDKKIYLSSTDKSLISLDAINGKKIWEFKTEGMAAIRGLILNEEEKSKIYFCDQVNLNAIYANSGKPVKEFGKNGKIKLKKKIYCSAEHTKTKKKKKKSKIECGHTRTHAYIYSEVVKKNE
jgi:glucose dehydrogenase